ncbi:hypothetical protein GEMRC1_007960 [Eukaryota sp. GEM-RC1]
MSLPSLPKKTVTIRDLPDNVASNPSLYRVPDRTSIYDFVSSENTSKFSTHHLLGTVEDFEDIHRATVEAKKLENYGPPSIRMSKSLMSSAPSMTSFAPSLTTQVSMGSIGSVGASRGQPKPDLAVTLNTIQQQIHQGEEDEKQFLSTLQPTEQSMYLRENRAMKNYQLTLQKWDRFKKHMSKKLNISENSLVMSRVDSYRSQVENRVKRSQIARKRDPNGNVSENYWQTSLRGGGVSFVPISANPFSGLYVPITFSVEPKPVDKVVKDEGFALKGRELLSIDNITKEFEIFQQKSIDDGEGDVDDSLMEKISTVRQKMKVLNEEGEVKKEDLIVLKSREGRESDKYLSFSLTLEDSGCSAKFEIFNNSTNSKRFEIRTLDPTLTNLKFYFSSTEGVINGNQTSSINCLIDFWPKRLGFQQKPGVYAQEFCLNVFGNEGVVFQKFLIFQLLVGVAKNSTSVLICNKILNRLMKRRFIEDLVFEVVNDSLEQCIEVEEIIKQNSEGFDHSYSDSHNDGTYSAEIDELLAKDDVFIDDVMKRVKT